MSKKKRTPGGLASGIMFGSGFNIDRPPDDATTLNQALALHQQGQLGQAELLYRQVLANNASHVVALNLLGMLLNQTSRSLQALQPLTTAVQLEPDYAQAWNNMGLALRKLERYEESAQSYENAVRLNPGYVEAWINYANVLRNLQRYQDAVAACCYALRINPESAHALNTQGAALNDLGRHEEALPCLSRSVSLRPEFANAYFNLGEALSGLRRYHESLPLYEKAIQHDPGNVVAWNNQGLAKSELQLHEDAVRCYRQALSINPLYLQAHLNLGASLMDLNRLEEALKCFSQAIVLDSKSPGALAAHGQCLLSLKQYAPAAESFSRLERIEPHYKFARGQYFEALTRGADWNGVPQLTANMIRDVESGLPSAMPFTFLAVQDSAENQLRCAQIYARDQYHGNTKALCEGGTYQHQRIRLAYLSSDFYDHATAQLMVEVFEAHDRDRFEVTALSFGNFRADAMRERLQACFHQFVDVTSKSDAEIAHWMRTHEIDIAIDLKGYTQDSRPGIFLYRGAPVQVNFLGYPGTMGSPHWNYIISDPYVTPVGDECYFSERVVRLPYCYQPNCASKQIATYSASRTELGLPEFGFVFCCFNHSYKITQKIFEVWMRLLQKTANSVLWL